MCRNRVVLVLFLLGCIPSVLAQQTASTSPVPPLVNFSGVLTDETGKALTGIVGVTFSLYKDSQGGSPLWIETQNIHPDSTGRYTVMLGSATSSGIPSELFASGEARWLAVHAQGQSEQPRVMLLSVPYALKAVDAQTIGGLPPSAFLMVVPSGSVAEGNSSSPSFSGASPNVSGSGTTNFIPLWTPNGTTLGNSVFFQSGSGSSAKIGLGLTAPLATLDVGGTTLIRGTLEPITKGIANATKGFNSNPLDLEASSFSSTTHKAVMQHFEWQAEPTGNNTNNPGATLNLLFGQDNNTPAETGLKLSNKGVFTFAAGQTFPGTGDITAVNAGADLTGGGTSGSVTLNLDTTKVPLLASSNTFTATQHIGGDVDATGNVNASLAVTGALGVFSGSSTEGVFGQTTGSVGVLGVSSVSRAVEGDDSANGGIAVFGDELGTSGSGLGVLGQSFSPNSIAVQGANFGGGGFGVYGFENRPDNTGVIASGVRGVHQGGSFLAGSVPYGSGVWGDTGDSNGLAMLATADSGNAMAVFNNSTTFSTMFITNFEESTGSATVLDVSSFFGGFCNILANGSISCNGALSSVVPAESKKVQVYSVQSPENWFEDFGSGQLAGGVARVHLESTFAQTVNMSDYHVFVTPKGDCKGLFVTNETAGGFEVRELNGGQSNVAFDYRIVAHRKGYENLRLADATEISKVPVIQRTNRPNQVPTRPVPAAPTRQMASAPSPVK